MKPTKEVSELKIILNQSLGVHKNNCETVIDFTIAMQKARTVNLGQMVNYSTKANEISSESIYKNYQRLIHNTQISQNDLAKAIMAMYELNDCKLTLSLDRTNWRYGKADINLLVLSVCVLGTAIPIYWLELNTRGNSNTEERKQVIEMFLAQFDVNKIEYLVADREFIGSLWFNYLTKLGIKFVIRIKKNAILTIDNKLISANNLFKQVACRDLLGYPVTIDGIELIAQATRSVDNELVIVVSNNLLEANLLDIYSRRWKIECLFGQLKKRGFNFEDTHITIKHRVSNLLKLVVISFAVCYLVGLVAATAKPILIKKHGYKLKSFFRTGYDLMIKLINLSCDKAIQMIVNCFNQNNLMQKCKQLICVMY